MTGATIANMELLNDLNSEQNRAVTHEDGPLLIIAGAGTGKTTVITRRIAYLVEKKLARTDEILALTFTEKAKGTILATTFSIPICSIVSSFIPVPGFPNEGVEKPSTL